MGCSWLADGGTFSRAAAFGKTWGPGAERALTTSPSPQRAGKRSQAENGAVTIFVFLLAPEAVWHCTDESGAAG